MNKYRIWTVILIVAMVGLGWLVYKKSTYKLGLDLAGGTELIYKADTSQVLASDVGSSMEVLKDVIERRVNLFGVSEPVVQVEGAGTFSKDNKLIVDLPGISNVQDAIKLIGQTPLLEFKLLPDNFRNASTSADLYKMAVDTGLTGRLLSRANLEFNNQQGGQPMVGLQFNSEGSALLAKISRENKGKILAIFLDGEAISIPTLRDEISNGQAQISGGFTAPEARTLVKNLNYGALPVPIELVSTQTIGPTLGASALNAGIKAGIVGFLIIVAFLILWYRLPGFVASVALIMYIVLSLLAFKFIPVTLTAAGIAGFILSIGMAVDANILIFERMKEELRRGKNLHDAMHEGFHRAWLSIRDSNISSIITALVLFWLGTSSVKGFALTLGLGVVISMFTAITVSRTFLFALSKVHPGKFMAFLFGSGLRSKNLTNHS
jgi:preprotein translocase subunit SecD